MGKIIITGPGRSGTTFLVQLLTRLSFDTGFEPYKEPYSSRLRAGCEKHYEFDLGGPLEKTRAILDAAPRVLKSPEWSFLLKGFVRRGILEVDHVFVPFRDLDEAARSRLDVGLEWHALSTDDYAERVEDQASVHALAFGRALEACLVCNIPCTVVLFPKLVEDEQYCYDKLSQGLEIDREGFGEVFRELARPKQVVWRNGGRNR